MKKFHNGCAWLKCISKRMIGNMVNFFCINVSSLGGRLCVKCFLASIKSTSLLFVHGKSFKSQFFFKIRTCAFNHWKIIKRCFLSFYCSNQITSETRTWVKTSICLHCVVIRCSKSCSGYFRTIHWTKKHGDGKAKKGFSWWQLERKWQYCPKRYVGQKAKTE